jgi:hypothetical protein
MGFALHSVLSGRWTQSQGLSSAIIRYFAPKSPVFQWLGASRLKKFAFLFSAFVLLSLGLLACGGGGSSPSATNPSNGLTERVFASQSASSGTSFGALVIIDGENDTVARGGVSAGTSPGMMAITPDRSTLLIFDAASNKIDVVNTAKQSNTGSIQLPGATTSFVAPTRSVGFAAVPNATQIGSAPGAVVEMNLTAGGVAATISVPAAQTVVSNPGGSQILAFSNDSDSVTVVYPTLVNSGSPETLSIPGFDRPVFAVYSSDGSTAYVLNCGPQCGGTQASVQVVNVVATPPTLTGAPIPVDAATVAYLNGSTLYVAGTSPNTSNNACTGETTAATTCGRLDIVNLNSNTVTGTAVITDGYHNRIDLGLNGQLFIGSHTCTNIGNVNNVTGEVRGCLSIYNTNNNSVIIPADNGDVTGLQGFSSRYVEYVAEGGNLRVYDTQTDTLLDNSYISTGTIIITGFITDVKAVDFF